LSEPGEGVDGISLAAGQGYQPGYEVCEIIGGRPLLPGPLYGGHWIRIGHSDLGPGYELTDGAAVAARVCLGADLIQSRCHDLPPNSGNGWAELVVVGEYEGQVVEQAIERGRSGERPNVTGERLRITGYCRLGQHSGDSRAVLVAGISISVIGLTDGAAAVGSEDHIE
jgi:hypothetical protein